MRHTGVFRRARTSHPARDWIAHRIWSAADAETPDAECLAAIPVSRSAGSARTGGFQHDRTLFVLPESWVGAVRKRLCAPGVSAGRSRRALALAHRKPIA